MDAIKTSADPPFITLPAFSEDGTVQYGNGDAVADGLNRLFFTGIAFRIKDLKEMRECLRMVLREARYVREKSDAKHAQDGMYTLPDYLAKMKDAKKLMKRFLSSDTADTEANRKISVIASRLGI